MSDSTVIGKAGARLFLAGELKLITSRLRLFLSFGMLERYRKMLDDILFSTCGQTFTDSAHATNVPQPMEEDFSTSPIVEADPVQAHLDMFMQFKAPPGPPQTPQHHVQTLP